MYLDLPLDDPDRGRAFPCECTEARRRERRRRELREQSGLRALSRMTFDSFEFREGDIPEDHSKNLFDVWDAVRTYAEKPWPQGWLLLYGTYGCGKTHLAAAGVNHRIAMLERPAMFVVVPDFLDYLRSTFNPSAPAGFDDYFQRVKAIEFLVLDDLGAENSTPWVNETLFQLVNYRYNNELPTVFTSNAQVDGVEDRVRSRMLDNSFTERWAIQAPDYRLTGHSVAASLLHSEGNATASPEAATTSVNGRRPSRRKS
ncbi:MAG: ATP-binding protein [Chloroflexi bacterium]|nr:ATP-binding protein [Chloroflexota bacterium]